MSLDPVLTYIYITLSLNVIFSSKYCNAARIQKIWNLYKIINFRKFSHASKKIATARLLRAAEPWKFLRICETDINWKSQKHSPHRFILSDVFQIVWVGEGGVILPPAPPELEIGLTLLNHSLHHRLHVTILYSVDIFFFDFVFSAFIQSNIFARFYVSFFTWKAKSH